jgi:phage terminase large subunit
MAIKINKIYQVALTTDLPMIFLYGGRGAGRSVFVCQYILNLLLGELTPYKNKILLMRYIKGSLRETIWAELVSMLKSPFSGIDQNYLVINDQVMKIEYKGHIIITSGFFGNKDMKAKMKGYSNITHVVIDEFQELPDEKPFDDLMASFRSVELDNPKFNIDLPVDKNTNPLKLRTKPKTICAFNIPENGKNDWRVKKWFNLSPSEYEDYFNITLKLEESKMVYPIFSKYTDNGLWLEGLLEESLDFYKQEIYRNYEHLKHSDNPISQHRYKTEILALVGSGQAGLVFQNWEASINYKRWTEIDAVPTFGVDFGFSQDPTAIVGVKKVNDTFYVHCFLYKKGLTNGMIFQNIKNLIPNFQRYKFYCDNAPSTVADLRNWGLRAEIINKKAGSRVEGVNFMLGYKFVYTEESTMIAQEITTYHWLPSGDGSNLSNEPSDGKDHCIDAIRYNVCGRWFFNQNANIQAYSNVIEKQFKEKLGLEAYNELIKNYV